MSRCKHDFWSLPRCWGSLELWKDEEEVSSSVTVVPLILPELGGNCMKFLFEEAPGYRLLRCYARRGTWHVMFIFNSDTIRIDMIFQESYNQKSQGLKSREREGQVFGKLLEITNRLQHEHEKDPSLLGSTGCRTILHEDSF
ncbi:hypothetical protein AVEN_107172-1 [Araneus ventricosus]|uniref:Uncharacterized protein n=1 Tax=Araneus ventricosus TaxID=182803 RepID=A0A4Y2FH78_ARAVE|nr:hypothetical protein AVEN_107172-1 [Araneus ventricosus]